MLETYEDYLDLIEEEAVKAGIGDFRLAREGFHNLTGRFEDGEPWYELRMSMFLDWCLLDRPGPEGLTPLERLLRREDTGFHPDERKQLTQLAVTQRSIFRILELKDRWLTLADLARGGHWRAESTVPAVGLSKGDILGARVVLFGGHPTIGRGLVLHPREAHDAIEEIIFTAREKGLPPAKLVDHLDKMRLKLDRYSNVRIQHVYRYPDDALL